MRDGGDLLALLRLDLEDLHHERHVVVGLEPVLHRVAQDGGRERPEGFAALDLEVEDILHVGAARIAQDRTVAKRARPPLHAALEPADHLALGDRLRGVTAERRLVGDALDRAARRIEVGAARGDRRGDLLRRGRRPPVGMIHHEMPARLAVVQCVPGREGRADRPARIAAGRLDVDLLERRAIEDLAVGDRVVGAAARQHDGVGLVALVQRAQQVEEGVLVHRLRRARDVLVVIGERR